MFSKVMRFLLVSSLLVGSVSSADRSDWVFWDSFEQLDFSENIPDYPITGLSLVSVSSLVSTSAQVDWLAGASKYTNPTDMRYGLHFSTEKDFTPNASTLKKTVKGKSSPTLSAVVNGLQANTVYYAIVTATNQKNQTVQSNQLLVKTASSSVVRTAKTAYELPKSETGGAQTVVAGEITVPSTSKTVKVGDIIANKDNGGYLRKVTAVTQENGKTVIKTEKAPINEVFSDLDLSFSTKMIKKSTADGRQFGMRRLQRKSASNTDEIVWENGNLTLSYPTENEQRKYKVTPRSSGHHISQNSVLSISTKQKQYTFSADGKDELRFEVKINLKDNNFNFSNLSLIDLYREQRGFDAHFTNEAQLHPTSGNSQMFVWHPSKDKNDERKYVAVFKATAKKHSNCGWFGCGASNVTLRVPIYIGSEPKTEGNDKLVKVNGDFTAEAEIGVVFEPTANATFNLRGTKLENAELFFNGDLSISAKALLEAKGSASANTTKDIEALKRQFIKAFITPSGIPIVVRGELGIEAAFDANVSAELAVKPEYVHHFNVKFGFGYTNANGWYPIKHAEQIPHVEMKGKAKGEMDITIGLKPRLNVKFYEIGVLNTNVVPYLFNETKLQGEYDFLLGEPNGGLCFIQFDNGGGVDFNIHAGLEAWGWGIVGYPNRDPNSYKKFTIVPKTVLLGLPKLNASQLQTSPIPPLDSRSVLVKATAQSVPFGQGDSLNPWESGRWPRVIPRADSSVTPADKADEAWVTYKKPSGTFTASFFGHSRIGSLFQQCTDQVIAIKDADNDGMADRWESQFNVTDPNADDDCDGKTNIEEFNAGTYPNDATCSVALALISPSSNASLPANKPITVSGTATVGLSVIVSGSNQSGYQNACSAVADNSGRWSCKMPKRFAVPSSALQIKAWAEGAKEQVANVNIAAKKLSITQPTTGKNLPANKPITVSGKATPDLSVLVAVGTNRAFACSDKADNNGDWSCEIPASLATAATTLKIMAVEEAGNIPEQSVTVKINASTPITARPTKLNDTGITTCGTADSTSNSQSCSSAVANATGAQVPKGQDGHYGTGKNGSKGMSFSKVSGYEGKCVQDNHTGLMWEVKQDSGLHSKDHTYSWYSTTNNNGNAGKQNGGTCSGSGCDAAAFVDAVNAAGWCGHNDWRLPTRRELRSIVDYSHVNPAIDKTYFPNTKYSASDNYGRYWSSSPYAYSASYAWVVYFSYGYDYGNGKYHGSYVRLVRGSSDH